MKEWRRQGMGYIVVGLLLLGVDWLIFVALSSTGIATSRANIAGRIAGAALGFWLNGRWTFARGGVASLGSTHLARFVLFWLVTTVLSTLVVAQVGVQAGLKWAWLVKPFVDGLLAVLGFVVSKHWVYRQ